MTTIIERPLLDQLAVEVLDVELSPFTLDLSLLDTGTLGGPGTEPVWTDWIGKMTNVTVKRGGQRNGITINNQPGMMTLTIQDYWEPDFYAPRFAAGATIRLVQITTTGRAALFTGKIRDMDISLMQVRPGQPPVPITTIIAMDAVVEHDDVTRYGAITGPAGESFGSRIARLTASATAPIEQPAIQDYARFSSEDEPIRLAPTVLESSLSNHFTLACNSVGAMWWVGMDGITRFATRGIFNDDGTQTSMRFSSEDVGPQPNELHGIDFAIVTGSKATYTVGIARNLSAQPSEDDPTRWEAVEGEYVYRTPIPGERLARLPVVTDSNVVGVTDDASATTWLERLEWTGAQYTLATPHVQSVRWNAQEDLDSVPGLEIGAYVQTIGAPYGMDFTQIIGVAYTITPTRWMVDLTLIGAYPR